MKGKNILIVDDEVDLTLTFTIILESKGFKVDSFNDPILALSNFKTDYYDLIILDIKMPKMNGFQFYNNIKQRDKNVKLIFLTASEEFHVQYRNEEFYYLDKELFVQKPVSIEELLKKINQIMRYD